MATIQASLDKANLGELDRLLAKVKLGTALAALKPTIRTRSGLASSAAQVHDVPGLIASVNATAGTPLSIVHGSAPDSGEVRIEYDADGLATLTFNAAVTGYTCSQMGYSDGTLADQLAATWSGTT